MDEGKASGCWDLSPPFFYRPGRFAEMEPPPPPPPPLTIVPPSTYASDILLLAGYEYTCIQRKGCILAIEYRGACVTVVHLTKKLLKSLHISSQPE